MATKATSCCDGRLPTGRGPEKEDRVVVDLDGRRVKAEHSLLVKEESDEEVDAGSPFGKLHEIRPRPTTTASLPSSSSGFSA